MKVSSRRIRYVRTRRSAYRWVGNLPPRPAAECPTSSIDVAGRGSIPPSAGSRGFSEAPMDTPLVRANPGVARVDVRVERRDPQVAQPRFLHPGCSAKEQWNGGHLVLDQIGLGGAELLVPGGRIRLDVGILDHAQIGGIRVMALPVVAFEDHV